MAESTILLAVKALLRWGEDGTGYLFGGGLAYLIGTFMVTIVFNVPLNNTLASSTKPAKVVRGSGLNM